MGRIVGRIQKITAGLDNIPILTRFVLSMVGYGRHFVFLVVIAFVVCLGACGGGGGGGSSSSTSSGSESFAATAGPFGATIAGLKALRRPDEIARLRGLDAEEFVPAALLEAYRRTEAGVGASSGSDGE